jgi:protein disulfide-isomerase
MRTPTPPRRRPRWLLIVVAIVLALTASLAWDLYRTATAKDLVPWRSDLTAAAAEAQADERPMLLYFTADWCGPCRMMRRDVYSDPDIAQRIVGAAVPVKLDLTAPQPGTPAYDTAMQLQIQGYPTLILMDPGNGEISRHFGYLGAEDLLDWLDRHGT